MFIYLARNKVNGKCYIGLTSRTLAVRRAEHIWAANGGSELPFHRAIRAHGKDSFEWTVVGSSSSKSELMQLEIEMIAAQRPAYNVTAGGESTKGIKLTAETRARMSASKKGKPKSEETKARMREAWKRRTPDFLAALAAANKARAGDPVIGAKISASHANRGPEWREKMSKVSLGRKQSPEHRANNRAAQQRRFRKEVDGV